MLDKKDMLVKVASYDKATCVLANTVIAYKEMMAKKEKEKEKETKTASVKEVVNGLISKYINK